MTPENNLTVQGACVEEIGRVKEKRTTLHIISLPYMLQEVLGVKVIKSYTRFKSSESYGLVYIIQGSSMVLPHLHFQVMGL